MESVMHLPGKAFSKNGFNTMEARAGSYIPLGGSDDLSEIDKAQLNLLYSCTGYPSKFSLRKFQTQMFCAQKIYISMAIPKGFMSFSRVGRGNVRKI